METNKIALAFVGMTGAGKTTAANYLLQKGFYGVYFGSIFLNELKKRHIDITPENEKKIIVELRSQYGNGMCAKYFLDEILCMLKTNNIVIDGLYSWSEYLHLKKHLNDNLIIVCVLLDKQSRYHRLSLREERRLSPEIAMKRDIREIETIEKGGPIAFADYYVLNNGSKKELYNGIDQIIGKVLNSDAQQQSF